VVAEVADGEGSASCPEAQGLIVVGEPRGAESQLPQVGQRGQVRGRRAGGPRQARRPAVRRRRRRRRRHV